MIIDPYRGRDRLRVAAGAESSAHKQVQVSVPIDVGQGHGTDAGFSRRQAIGRGNARPGVNFYLALLSLVQLVIRDGDEQFSTAMPIGPSQDRASIGGKRRCACQRTKAFSLAVG